MRKKRDMDIRIVCDKKTVEKIEEWLLRMTAGRIMEDTVFLSLLYPDGQASREQDSSKGSGLW